MRKGWLLSLGFALLLWGTLQLRPVWAADGAQFSEQNVPTVMVPGQSYLVGILMKNTGDTTWTAAAQYKLGSQNPQDNLTWGVNRADLNSGGTPVVQPGNYGFFYFLVVAPTTPGVYNFQWQMIHEGVGWFGALTPNIPVVVSPGGTGACAEGCRNSTTFNPTGPTTGSYWVARNNQNQTISVFVNGSTANVPQPGGSTPTTPAIEGFGSKVFLVVRGTDNAVWRNSWNGISWSGWMKNGSTLNSPDLVIFNNTLFLAVTGSDHGMYRDSYTTTWLGWEDLGGYLNDAQICADTAQIRVGGTGRDGRCYSRPSGNGSIWDLWAIAPPCP